jgi:hypothetical protein
MFRAHDDFFSAVSFAVPRPARQFQRNTRLNSLTGHRLFSWWERGKECDKSLTISACVLLSLINLNIRT